MTLKDIDLSNGIRLTKKYVLSYGRLMIWGLISLGLMFMILLENAWAFTPSAIAVWITMLGTIKREMEDAEDDDEPQIIG